MADDEAKKTLQSISTNLKNSMSGQVYPEYEGIPELLRDSTSPLIQTAEELADKICNVSPVPKEGEPSKQLRAQTREEIEQMVVKIAGKLGFMFQKAHLEDLIIIAKTDGVLTMHSVWMYMRGAMRSDQISLVSKLSNLVSSMEVSLNRSQQTILANTDSNKLISEKFMLLSAKTDAITPTISSLIQAEHGLTRKAIISSVVPLTVPVPNQSIAPGDVSSSAPIKVESGKKVSFPGRDQITEVFEMIGCPSGKARDLAVPYVGKVSWDEYNAVVVGKMDVNAIKGMIRVWKSRI